MRFSLWLPALLLTACVSISYGSSAGPGSHLLPFGSNLAFFSQAPENPPGHTGGGSYSKGNASAPSSARPSEITIPGPLRSFLRMAGLSQKASPEEVLPLLAHEVRVKAYDRGRPTEFLVLLRRYLQQAGELVNLAGTDGVIRVSNCQDAQPLLAILGYRLREDCGPTTALQTADVDRAFLTIDSGFPLAELEETLQGGKPFVLPFPSTHVPVLFTQNDWTADVHNGGVLEALLGSPSMARLYGAMSRMDVETAENLRQSPGLRRLLRNADVLDFYGSHIFIRGGRVVVPGGASAEGAWKELVGAAPDSPAEFVTHLLSKDEGWLAAYYDALSDIGAGQQAYFTDAHHLKRFYEAMRGHNTTPGPARAVFRSAPGLPILAARLYLDPNGQPHIPGNLEAWKNVFHLYRESKPGREWAGRAAHWKEPEQLLEGMFGLSREPLNFEPLELFLLLNEMDRGRSPDQRLTPEAVRLLAERYSRFGDQYQIFSEFSGLNSASIINYLNVAQALDHIPAPALRANSIGTFQATLGLWQILARQGEIPPQRWNDSWQLIIAPFAHIAAPTQLFDAARNSVSELLKAATGDGAISQDTMVALLAGPPQSTVPGRQVHDELARRIQSILQAQRLVSLDTLFALGAGLTEMAHGKASGDSLLPLATELREFEMPRPIFTSSEKYQFQHEHVDTRHTTLQTRTNLTRVIKSGTPQELAEARGQLAAFIRDTLVGLNYAYYEPPGAQMLYNNAIFVRSHDYAEDYRSGKAGAQPWKSPMLVNLGVTASGGTHLAGSLADLPYTLAVVEQDFIVPENVQSLIWQDLVPSLLTSAVLPRWWNVSPTEMHAVALYQKAGEELLASAAENEKLRAMVMTILSDRIDPQRAERIESALQAGKAADALGLVTPAETFYLTAQFPGRFPGADEYWGAAGKELQELTQRFPNEVNWQRLSHDFGVPHPALSHSYSRELLNVKLFPVFQSYSSRLLAESWESNNLYWARLADERGYPPVMLNRLVPVLTRRMIEKLFAATLEDWPAVLRAMHETGEEFRSGKMSSLR